MSFRLANRTKNLEVIAGRFLSKAHSEIFLFGIKEAELPEPVPFARFRPNLFFGSFWKSEPKKVFRFLEPALGFPVPVLNDSGSNSFFGSNI